MVTIDMCGKSQTRGSGYMELRERIYYLLCFLFSYLFSLFNNIFTFLYLQCLICVLVTNRIFILKLFLFLSL